MTDYSICPRCHKRDLVVHYHQVTSADGSHEIGRCGRCRIEWVAQDFLRVNWEEEYAHSSGRR